MKKKTCKKKDFHFTMIIRGIRKVISELIVLFAYLGFFIEYMYIRE